MIALIMAGGSGTRFWPQSRKNLPKQFLNVLGEKSMIRLTVERLLPELSISDIYVVTAANQVELVKEHIPELPVDNIIIEPFGMNTAPCIGLSIAYLRKRYSDEQTMIVLPADHVIRNTSAFIESLHLAEAPAKAERLVTFGILPDYPATGYGYIEAGVELSEGIRNVVRFKEKPDHETAQGFLASGNFFWNSGMFCWKLNTIWNAFCSYLPTAVQVLEQISERWDNCGYSTGIDDLYALMPKTPIDIGIMEKAELRAVLPVDLGWSDVGSWKALAEISPSDERGNSQKGDCLFLGASGNFVSTPKFTALIGVSDLCVIDTGDALLICHRDSSEEVKKVIDHLSQNAHDELL